MPKRSSKTSAAPDAGPPYAQSARQPPPAVRESSRRKPRRPSHVMPTSSEPSPPPADAVDAADGRAAQEPAAGDGRAGPARPRADGSRRKQPRPHRVAADAEPFGDEVLIKAEQPSPSARPAAASTTSLIASLKGKRAPKPRQALAMVTCGVCKENMNEKAFERHALSTHMGMARPSGQSQEFSRKEKVNAFNRVLKFGGKLMCSLCSKVLTSALGFFHHHSQCGKDIQPVQCPKCDWFLKPLSLPQHLRNHEKQSSQRGEDEPPKKSARHQTVVRRRQETSDEEEVDSGPEDGEDATWVGKREAGRRPRSAPGGPESPAARRRQRTRGVISADMGGELTYFTAVERQACARDAAAAYWQQQPKSAALGPARPDPSEWWPCGGEEKNCYSPPMKLSPAYKVQEIGSPDPYRSYERIDTYTFEELDNGVLCFCGGPVTGCDWCPRPGTPPEEVQYLAVSCLPVVDRSLPPTQPSSLPSSVQLWAVPEDLRSARMGYAVCVDGGPVWDLVWCPVGSRTPRSADRLGRLALACGDGRVRVYTMPSPDSLPAGDSKSAPFYTKAPDLRLEVFGDIGRSPCIRLDWAKSDGNRVVAGIFGNGTVAIWDVTTTSPVLCDMEGPTRILYHVQVIAAHRGHGTAVTFSPFGDRHLCSGGRDRTLQLWDREEPAPLQRASTKLRPMLADLCWPVATKKLITAYDHSLFTGSPTVMVSDAAMPVPDVPLFTHGAKCTSVAVCEAVNGLACGSESGLVALAHWRGMLSHKQKGEMRRLLLKVEAEKMMPHVSGEQQLLGDQYMQVWESCGLTIWEAKLKERSSVIMDGFDEHVSNTGSWISNYPFVAVNKVSWNRNSGAASWLAVGLESGLLRLLSVPAGAFSAVRS